MYQGPVGTGQRVLVICVKFSEGPAPRLAQASDWAALLSRQVNGLFRRMTYNQTDFSFEIPVGGPSDGWFDLGFSTANYSFDRTAQRAVTLADPLVNFANYNRVVVITNWPGFGGQGLSLANWTVSDGIEFYDMTSGVAEGKRAMSLSICNEWVANSNGESGDAGAAVIAHELGHHLGLLSHYGDVRFSPGATRDSITPWDLMGKSPFQRHFLGWAKRERGWLRSGRVRTVTPSATDQVIRLQPLEISASTGTQLIMVPFSATGDFEGYVLENRQALNGDEQLTDTGVLVSLVDESREVVPGYKVVVMDNANAPGDGRRAALGVGESFQDAEYGIEVEVVGDSGNDRDVRLRYPPAALNRPDPSITNWGAPPWETPDIWIDSQRNGWGTYRYVDAAGNPVGNGDPPWLEHDNRVYVRVTNAGRQVASNVRVQVFVNGPPGMGDAGPHWHPIGTILFGAIPPTASASDYVVWRPTVGAHTCIRAVIDDSPGELSTSNNRAQENVAVFESTRSSPWQPVETQLQVFSVFGDEPTPVRIDVSDVPAGWAVKLHPTEMELQPGEVGMVSFSAFPAGPPGMEEEVGWERYKAGYIGKPKIEARVPFADTFVASGGVEVWVHLVEATTVDLKADVDGDDVIVEGAVSPAPLAGVVAIELDGDLGKPEFVHADIGEDGRFVQRIPVKGGFVGRVRASFAGTDVYGSSESETVVVG